MKTVWIMWIMINGHYGHHPLVFATEANCNRQVAWLYTEKKLDPTKGEVTYCDATQVR